jgi:hypothetical protein
MDHQRVLENQSDRIGLQYMIDGGYDTRQAPAVWKLMANGVQATNFFWSSHGNAPTRRSYLMNELKNSYRDIDYSPLQVNVEDYSRIKAAVTAANGQKKKINRVDDDVRPKASVQPQLLKRTVRLP